jgi:hypothetical protein
MVDKLNISRVDNQITDEEVKAIRLVASLVRRRVGPGMVMKLGLDVGLPFKRCLSCKLDTPSLNECCILCGQLYIDSYLENEEDL